MPFFTKYSERGGAWHPEGTQPAVLPKPHLPNSLPERLIVKVNRATFVLYFCIHDSSFGAKELDRHPNYERLRLSRNHRLVYTVLEEAQVVDLLYLGPKPPGLYERLGLGRQE